MQPLEIDSAVFCDGARYTIISRENSSILTCPVASGAGGYTLNRVEGRDIDLELDRLTGHAACIAVDVPTWCRIAGDPLDAVADALADLLCETPTHFELERLAAASPVLTANTPGIPVFPAGIAPAANSYTLAGGGRLADRGRRWRTRVLRLRGYRRGPEEPPARGPGRGRRGQAARRRGARRIVRHAVAQHGRPLPGGATCRRGARALPLARRPRDAGPRRQEGRGIDRAGRGRRARAGALVAALPVREHAFTRRVRVPIIRAISASPAPSARRTA